MNIQRFLATVAVSLLLAACTPADGQLKGTPLQEGTTVGKVLFPPGDSFMGGNGQPIDGIEASSHEMLKSHSHTHLSLFYRGEQIAIPEAVGIVKPYKVERGFVTPQKAIYWLHTHDATGIIHVESPDDRTYTLANFFHIWGQPLTETSVANLQGKVRAYVNGKPYSGDPGKIVLQPRAEITLVVGDPVVTPPSYIFPEGL